MIYDFIPAAFDFDAASNPNWTVDADNTASFVFDEVLGVGEATQVDIILILNGSDFTTEGLTNIAEIGQVFDLNGVNISGFDVDSTPDDTVGNDDGGELNGDTDNTTGNEQGDEDDSDPAAICTFVIECPEDIVATDGCTVEPFDNLADAGFLLGESCDNLMVCLLYTSPSPRDRG